MLTTSTLPFSSTGWHFVALTYSGGALSSSTLKLSIDTTDYPFATYSGTPNTSNSTFAIGEYSGGTGWPWKGYIDEVGVWTRDLSTGEIMEIYNGGMGRAYPLTVNKEMIGVGTTTGVGSITF